MAQMTATYSPEDNKVRLYPDSRLDQETFERVKAAGFKWAPKQELFVAPKWTPGREDLALELAGEIEPEEMTLAERAAVKAERLDALAEKRGKEASAFRRAASELSEQFHMGQPILVGHHSERKARKAHERMTRADEKAVKASKAVNYWLYRADGVERFANMKNDPKVRVRRIKTLLAELRSLQRAINDANKALSMWARITDETEITKFLNYSDLAQAPFGLWSDVTAGKVSAADARAQCIARCEAIANGSNRARWITHTLNRLAYEREFLGNVPRFSGEVTPTVLQSFVREHGADKPKAEKLDDELFSVQSPAPLPAHIGNGDYIEMTADDWRDLMQSAGYHPPAKKPGKPPILNFKAPSGKVETVNPWQRETESLVQRELTKEEYAKIHSEQRGTRLSACGGFRIRICPDPHHEGPRYSAGWVAVFISDQKAHPLPESILEGAQ